MDHAINRVIVILHAWFDICSLAEGHLLVAATTSAHEQLIHVHCRLGQRVMKNQDGSLDVQRDTTFLAESGMLPKVGCSALDKCCLKLQLPVSCDLQTI